MKALAFASCFAIACSAERPSAVTIAHEPEKPVATIDGSLLPPRTPAASASACLMLYECGCNAGCTKIDHDKVGLAPGMQVTVASGSLKGTPVFVAKQHGQSGGGRAHRAARGPERADPDLRGDAAVVRRRLFVRDERQRSRARVRELRLK